MSNTTLIEHFLKTKKEKSPRTVENYRRLLQQYEKALGKPLDQATIKDVEAFLDRECESKKGNIKKAKASRGTYKVYLRQFYKWRENKKLVEGLPVHHADMQRTKPISVGDLLTKQDVADMVKVGTNFRDQAVIAVLYETGARVGEFLGLKVGDVVFDKFGAFFTVNGKTGARRIRIIESVPYLQQWMQTLGKRARQSPLWVSLESPDVPLSIGAIALILRSCAKRANINKPCNPHWLRHSRLTETAKFLIDGKEKVFAGWKADSRMSAIYVHLSGSDLDDDLLKASGVKVTEKVETSPMAPKKCSRCETVNAGIAEYCTKCGLPFDASKIIETTTESMIEELLKSSEFRKRVLEIASGKKG